MNQPLMAGVTVNAPAYVKNAKLIAWVAEVAALTQPDAIYWCDGSQEEYDRLCRLLVDAGSFKKLNPAKRASSYLAWTDPSDVARVEDRTYICSAPRKKPARPTTGWPRPRCAPAADRRAGAVGGAAMRGRTMYVVPFSMGPLARRSPTSASRSPTAPTSGEHAHHDRAWAKAVFDVLGTDGEFVPCVHTVGAPLAPGKTSPGRATRRQSTSSTTPRRARSGPTARATAATRCSARKCFALRIASDGPRPGLAGRAHADPGRDLARRWPKTTSPPPSRRLRQDQLRDADPAPAFGAGR